MKIAVFSTKRYDREFLTATTIANITQFETTGRCENQLAAK